MPPLVVIDFIEKILFNGSYDVLYCFGVIENDYAAKYHS